MNTSTPRSRSHVLADCVNRNATSLTASFFLVIGTTGVMLFFHLQKDVIKPLHEWLGLGLVIAVFMHLVRNQRQLMTLCKQVRTRFFLGAVTLIVAAFIALAPEPKPNPVRLATQALIKAKIENLSALEGESTDVLLDRLRKAGARNAASNATLEKLAADNQLDTMQLLSVALGKVR